MKATVLVTDYSWADLDVERRILAEVGAKLVTAETGHQDELVALAPRADAILTCWKRVSAEVLAAAPRCLTVARYGVGLDNIDVTAATRLGIIVTNVPDFCIHEVAEHTVALLLAQARHLGPFALSIGNGQWSNHSTGLMHRVHGRVVGLIGWGNIAKAVATRLQAFGCHVIVFSRSTAGAAPRDGVRFVANLGELLRVADVVSLHLPATPATHKLIGAAELAAMKPDAILVNTSRGALVDENALVDALRQRRLGGAALDVLAQEPPPPDHPLLTLASVTLTPHAAFDSVEAIAELQRTAAHNVAAVLSGRRPRAIANPEVLDSTVLRAGGEVRR